MQRISAFTAIRDVCEHSSKHKVISSGSGWCRSCEGHSKVVQEPVPVGLDADARRGWQIDRSEYIDREDLAINAEARKTGVQRRLLAEGNGRCSCSKATALTTSGWAGAAASRRRYGRCKHDRFLGWSTTDCVQRLGSCPILGNPYILGACSENSFDMETFKSVHSPWRRRNPVSVRIHCTASPFSSVSFSHCGNGFRGVWTHFCIRPARRSLVF